MFWDKGYTPSQNIEALLEKENATVEEFLDDEDILQECKTLKKAVVNYFTRPDIIRRLVEFIITEPSEDLPMAQRFRHANMACEILTLGLPSLDEKLLSDADTLKILYSYLENEPPLNTLLSSFFSKTFSMLFTKKAEQDWFLYQQMCLQLLEYVKSQHNFLDLICKHFNTPVIPDLIMQMMKDVEGGQLKRNLYEWLTEDKLVERLITILGDACETDKHANVAEFLCDLIQQGRSMRQTEQENDSFEPAFDGSNPILKNIESAETIEALLNVILEPNAHESAIVSGISVVHTLIKPVVFVDEPNSDRMKYLHQREGEIHEQILATVISVIAPRLKEFNELLRNPPNKPEIVTTAAKLTSPFGMTRLQICRLFTVLLQTHNEDVANAICETDFFETLLALFKQYCWNNFLHSEVEKCLQLIFYTQLLNNNNSAQGSTIVNDGSFGKGSSINGDHSGLSMLDFILQTEGGGSGSDGGGEGSNMDTNAAAVDSDVEENADNTGERIAPLAKAENHDDDIDEDDDTDAEASKSSDEELEESAATYAKTHSLGGTTRPDGFPYTEYDTTRIPTDTGPSALQIHVIVNCKLISKLIDCWQHNQEMETAEKGRRLGYMGHLIKIFKHITNCISESEHIGALIESNLTDPAELELWQSLIDPITGDFTKALFMQSKMLANCNAHEAGDYSQHLPKDFLGDNSSWDIRGNMLNRIAAFNDSSVNDILFELENEILRTDITDITDNLFQFGSNIDDDDDDDDDEDNATAGEAIGCDSLFGKTNCTRSKAALRRAGYGVTSNPWDNMDPFSDITAAAGGGSIVDVAAAAAAAELPTADHIPPWAADFGTDNFADFDAHFSSFSNDLGESLANDVSAVSAQVGAGGHDSSSTSSNSSSGSDHEQPQEERVTKQFASEIIERPEVADGEEYDNNANVEKSPSSASASTSSSSEDDNAKNEKVDATEALVRTLRAVMQDSEDDYEDDEGMWTKPLGGDRSNEQQEEEEEAETAHGQQQEPAIANGPSSKAASIENNEELNNSVDKSSITSTNTTATADDVVAAPLAAALTTNKRTTTGDDLKLNSVEVAPTTT